MQDWERFGEEIRRTVQDAVDSQDYRKLNQTITDTINRAVNGAVNGAEQGMRSFGNAFDQATRNMGRGQDLSFAGLVSAQIISFNSGDTANLDSRESRRTFCFPSVVFSLRPMFFT